MAWRHQLQAQYWQCNQIFLLKMSMDVYGCLWTNIAWRYDNNLFSKYTSEDKDSTFWMSDDGSLGEVLDFEVMESVLDKLALTRPAAQLGQ
jgi:hypothetical protein